MMGGDKFYEGMLDVSDRQGLELEAKVRVEVTVDANYGANADGKQGVYRELVEGVEILSLKNEAGHDVVATAELRDIVHDEAWDRLEELEEVKE